MNRFLMQPLKSEEQREEQALARKGLLKMIITWTLYAIGALVVGVAVIFWFIIQVMVMPFTESGRR